MQIADALNRIDCFVDSDGATGYIVENSPVVVAANLIAYSEQVLRLFYCYEC